MWVLVHLSRDRDRWWYFLRKNLVWRVCEPSVSYYVYRTMVEGRSDTTDRNVSKSI